MRLVRDSIVCCCYVVLWGDGIGYDNNEKKKNWVVNKVNSEALLCRESQWRIFVEVFVLFSIRNLINYPENIKIFEFKRKSRISNETKFKWFHVAVFVCVCGWKKLRIIYSIIKQFYEIFQLAMSLFEFPMCSSLRLWWFSDDEDDVAGVVPDDDDLLPTTEPLSVPLPAVGFGPQMRTVPSSEHEANIDGYTGFQLTQLTVRVWPVRVAKGSSRRICQMYTVLSSLPLAIKLSLTPPKHE